MRLASQHVNSDSADDIEERIRVRTLAADGASICYPKDYLERQVAPVLVFCPKLTRIGWPQT